MPWWDESSVDWMNMAKEISGKLKDMSTESSQTEEQREKRIKKGNRISKNCETITKGTTYK